MPVAYAGFDILYPCLTALEAAGCHVMEVFTCPTDQKYEFNDQVRAFAEERHVPCTTERVTPADLARLRANGCRLLLSAGYYYLLPVDPELCAVNVHPALLPEGRGPWPTAWALLNGIERIGVTLHRVGAKFDEGDIVLQEPLDVLPEDDLETLTDRAAALAADLCARLVRDFDHLMASARPQGPGGSWWPMPGKARATITRETSPEQADRILRAVCGFPCWLEGADGVEREIVRARFEPGETGLAYGAESTLPSGAAAIAVNGGRVIVPPAGGRRQDGADSLPR